MDSMNNRGQVVEFIFASIVIGITLFSVYTTINEGTKIYVGDKSEKVYYEYSKCEDMIKAISEENLIVFNSQDEANKESYKAKAGCI